MRKVGRKGKEEDKIYMLQLKGPVPVFEHLQLSADVLIRILSETLVR